MKIASVAALATIAVAALAPLAGSAQPYEQRFVGRVVNFQPYNLQLDVGPHIYLHHGTVLRPLGLNLTSGMPVVVIGHQDVNGSFQADEVDLAPPPRYFGPRFRRYPL